MNKVVKIFAAVITLVWIFVVGNQLGKYNSQRKAEKSQINSVVVATVPATVPLITSQQQTQAPSVNTTVQNTQAESDTTTQATSQTVSAGEETTEVAPQTTEIGYEEIAELFNSAMNNTKKSDRTCLVKTVSTVKINIVDCSVQAAINPINSVIQRFAADNKEEEMLFTNGVSDDGLTIMSQLPPMGKETSLTADGIADAIIEDYNDGKKITITIVEETASLDTTPVHHASSIGYVDAKALDVPVTITQADMHYPGATITICTNSDGLMTSYEREYPMSGSGTANLGPLEGSASFEGSLEDNWTFEWK